MDSRLRGNDENYDFGSMMPRCYMHLLYETVANTYETLESSHKNSIHVG